MNPQDLLMQAAGVEPAKPKPKPKDPYIGRKLADGRKIVGRDVFRGQDVYLIKEGIATVFLPAHEIEGEIRRVERNMQSKAKFDREMRERERREAAEEKARRDLDGFEKTFKSKISFERAVAALDKQVGLSGKYATRRDHMRRLAREGWRVTPGHPKEGRRAMGKDGSYYPEKGRDGISKIAMDYLAFLTNGAAQAKAAKKTSKKPSGPIEYVPFGASTLEDGYRIDGNAVKFWAYKKDAAEGAKAIGWPVNSLTKVHTRFSKGWALADGRFGLVSKESYHRALDERQGKRETARSRTPEEATRAIGRDLAADGKAL